MLAERKSELLEAVALALDSVRRNPLRSGLTILGMVIGVAIVIAITAVINGLNSNVVASIEDLGSNIIICYRFPWAQIGRPPSEWFTRKELEAQWAEEIAQLPGVDSAAATLRIFRPEFGAGTSYVRRGGFRAKNVIIQGGPPEVREIFNISLARGRAHTLAEEEHRAPVVVLGYDTAKTLFPAENDDPIDQEVIVDGHSLRVIGVFDRRKQAVGSGANPEDNLVSMPLSTMRKLYPNHKDYVIWVKAQSAELVPQVVDSVRDLLRRKRRLASNRPDDFAIFTPDSFIELWKQLTTAIFAVVFVAASVALLVGAIGIMNIMLVSVTERTREIGVRKAIGARRSDILRQFLLEAMALSGVGGVIGIVLGALIALVVRLLAPSLPAAVSFFWVAFALLMCAFIGISFGIYPAWKAAKLDPVEALRYE
jgi:putative ABC transport system permease protein